MSIMVQKRYYNEIEIIDGSQNFCKRINSNGFNGEVGCFIDEKLLQKRLKTGESFGELAYTFNRANKTTYKCLETSQIYVITKSNLPSILKDFERQHQARITQPIFKTSSFFSDWDLGSISYLNYYGQIQQYVRNQIVYTKNMQADGIYLIVKGEFSYSIKQKQGKKKLQINQEGQLDSDEEQQKLDKEINDLRVSQTKKTFISKISTLSSGQIFGEEELLKKQNRQFDTTCDSVEGVLMFFNTNIFWSLIYSNPSSKEILDDKLKKQDIIQKRQINFIKSSMDDYDHYLLGKQYAHAQKQQNDDEHDNIPLSLPNSRSVSKNNLISNNKKKKQQQTDEIKIAIEKIPVLDLKRINDQAKQFNQYSYDPQEEKFFNPNQSEQLIPEGSVTQRNQFKMQMRTNSTINNQCQLEFIKMQGPIHILTPNSAAKPAISNFSTVQQGTPNKNNNRNASMSQQDLEGQGSVPDLLQNENNTERVDIRIKLNKRQNINGFNNAIISQQQVNHNNSNNSFNTPTNQNKNREIPSKDVSSTNSNTNNNNNNELFDLIMANNSKKYGKQFIRMKKFIQEGGKMQEINKKKYSLKNLFGSDRSTPRAFIPQINQMNQEKSNSISTPFSPSAYKFDIQNFNSFQRDYITSSVPPSETESQNKVDYEGNLLTTQRQQLKNFLLYKQPPPSTPSNQQNDNNQGQENISNFQEKQYHQTFSHLKQFQPSTFAQAIYQNSTKQNINSFSELVQQNSQKNQTKDNQQQEFQSKKVNIPNLQLKSNYQNNFIPLNSTRNKSQNIDQSNYNNEMNEGAGQSTMDEFNEKIDKNQIQNISQTERFYDSQHSQTKFKIVDQQAQKQFNHFQNKILQGSINSKEDFQNLTNKQSTPLKKENIPKLQFSTLNNQINNFKDSPRQDIREQQLSSRLDSPSLLIDLDTKNKVTPIQFYKQKKQSVSSQFNDQQNSIIKSTPNKLQQQQIKKQSSYDNQKLNSLNSFSQISHVGYSQSQTIMKTIEVNSTNELLTGRNSGQNYQSIQELSENIDGLDINNGFQSKKKKNQRIRIKSDLPSLNNKYLFDGQQQKRDLSEQQQNQLQTKQIEQSQKQTFMQQQNSSNMLSPRLFIQQQRPLYHDSSNKDIKSSTLQNYFNKNNNPFLQKEKLLSKHIQAKFQIQDSQKISSFLEKIADNQKNKKQQPPQQFVFSYSSNQNIQSKQNNQQQHVKHVSDLHLNQQINNHSQQPMSSQTSYSLINPNQEKQFNQIKTKNDKKISAHIEASIKNQNEKKIKPIFSEKEDQQQPSSPQKFNYFCEDLGYNFIKSKQV